MHAFISTPQAGTPVKSTMVQISVTTPHILRRLSLRLRPQSRRDSTIAMPGSHGLALQMAAGGKFDLERDEGATDARLVFSGQRFAADGTGALGFGGAGVVFAGLFAEAERVEDAFVAEEVAWEDRKGGGVSMACLGREWVGGAYRRRCWWRFRACPCRWGICRSLEGCGRGSRRIGCLSSALELRLAVVWRVLLRDLTCPWFLSGLLLPSRGRHHARLAAVVQRQLTSHIICAVFVDELRYSMAWMCRGVASSIGRGFGV